MDLGILFIAWGVIISGSVWWLFRRRRRIAQVLDKVAVEGGARALKIGRRTGKMMDDYKQRIRMKADEP
jgi:hypothetical protein